MKEIRIRVGVKRLTEDGRLQDLTGLVRFEGEVLSRQIKSARGGARGVARRLFRTAGGQYLVHSVLWTRDPTQWTREVLVPVSPEDLGSGGRYEVLGRGVALEQFLEEKED